MLEGARRESRRRVGSFVVFQAAVTDELHKTTKWMKLPGKPAALLSGKVAWHFGLLAFPGDARFLDSSCIRGHFA